MQRGWDAAFLTSKKDVFSEKCVKKRYLCCKNDTFSVKTCCKNDNIDIKLSVEKMICRLAG